MIADEIRAQRIDPNPTHVEALSFIALMLREIAAQLADQNERDVFAVERKNKRQDKPIASAARRTSNGKCFYVHHWQLQASLEAINQAYFKPNDGQQPVGEIDVNESTIGQLGTREGAVITRIR